MGVESYVNVYSTSAISSTASDTAPVKIIDGRVAVHSIICIPVGGTANNFDPGTDITNNRCYYLAGSASVSDIYIKFGGMPEVTHNNGTGQAKTIQILTGGDGILFEDGVYLGKDVKAPNGDSTATDLMLTLTIFYTGGANA